MEYNDFTRLDNSPAAIRDYLAESGLAARKRWGQNFLVDSAARQALIETLAPQPGERIWEVGPGLGAMTSGLLEAGAVVTAFEIDHGMVRHLRRRFHGREDYAPEQVSGETFEDERPSFHVVAGDAVRTLPQSLRDHGRPEALLGNLPYNAAAPILWSALTSASPIPRIVCTVQREVAERMVAPPGSRNFGPFAVLCSLEYRARIVRKLPGGCFYPRPHVESSAVVLTASGAQLPIAREKILMLTDTVFTQPRKTISNNLKVLAGTRAETDRRLAAAGISGDLRPSALSVEDIVGLSREFEDLMRK